MYHDIYLQAIVRIERFMPDIVAVHKHSTAYRRMAIRGRNGRVYTYLVSGLASVNLSPARTQTHSLFLVPFCISIACSPVTLLPCSTPIY